MAGGLTRATTALVAFKPAALATPAFQGRERIQYTNIPYDRKLSHEPEQHTNRR
jgi:hypothetical protein